MSVLLTIYVAATVLVVFSLWSYGEGPGMLLVAAVAWVPVMILGVIMAALETRELPPQAPRARVVKRRRNGSN